MFLYLYSQLEFLNELIEAENNLGISISLLRHLPAQFALVEKLLLNHQDVLLVVSTEKEAVLNIFNDSDSSSLPTNQEYILTSDWPAGPEGTTHRHRMYCEISGYQIQILEATSNK